MTGTRALVRRPRRKMHLAHRDWENGVWISYCDLIVAADEQTVVHEFDSIGGVTARLIAQLRGIIRDHSGGHLCAHCRQFVMLYELIQFDRSHGVAFEYRLTA